MATPPRGQYVDVAVDSLGNAVTTTKVTVYVAVPFAAVAQTTLASIFSAETGAGAPANPFFATTGDISFWVAPGSYDIKIEDTGSPVKFATRVVRFDALPADKGIPLTALATTQTGTGNIVLSDTPTFTGNTQLTTGSGGGYLGRLSGDSIDQIQLRVTSARQPILAFGPGNGALDTSLYRDVAGVLRTPGALYAGTAVVAQVTTAAQTNLISNSNAGVTMGTTSVVAIERTSADTMAIYGSAINLSSTGGGASVFSLIGGSRQEITYAGGGSDALRLTSTVAGTGLKIGNDTNLYRQGSGDLRTDGLFRAGNQLFASFGAATQVRLGGLGNGFAGIAFGSAENEFISRTAAGVLTAQATTFGISGHLQLNPGSSASIYGPSNRVFAFMQGTLGSFSTGFIETYGTLYVKQGNGSASWDNVLANQHIYYGAAPAAASDARLKKDVSDLEGGLAAITALRPVTYRWKGEEHDEQHRDTKTKFNGFIAQEVREIIPQAITEQPTTPESEDDPFLALSQIEMIPHIVLSIQELSSRLAQLEAA